MLTKADPAPAAAKPLSGDWKGWTATPLDGGRKAFLGPGGIKVAFARQGWSSTPGRMPQRTSKPWAAFGADGLMMRDRRGYPRTFGSAEAARKAFAPKPVEH